MEINVLQIVMINIDMDVKIVKIINVCNVQKLKMEDILDMVINVLVYYLFGDLYLVYVFYICLKEWVVSFVVNNVENLNQRKIFMN